ncbi:MAG: phenylalanine--tRNA ligase subunit beta [Legionellales bacterium]|nr:phenylalanine--tRNA ligase subunit beta [Legionellales bacterium]
MAITLSLSWLSEILGTDFDHVEVADKLSILGLEAEVVTSTTSKLQHVVVGEVLKTDPHPNADRLRVCEVNIGETKPLTIVCGCPSVEAGIKVPVALIGAILPNLEIKQSKLRGIESEGMLCTAMELGFSTVKQPLLRLTSDAPVGADIKNHLFLDDHWITIEVTPNRGDCLCALGVAREIGVVLSNSLKVKPQVRLPFDDTPVSIEDARCSHYGHAKIKNINIHATLPFWMEQRLNAASIHRVNSVVDILNYVTLYLGQPMHAFDLDSLVGDVHVRKAKKDESIKVLDGQVIHLKDELVIADQDAPIALAGVIGGLDSSISDKTQNIFIESAAFPTDTIIDTSNHFDISTDAVYRYSRGIDVEQVKPSLSLAVELILDICGGNLVSSGFSGQPYLMKEIILNTTTPYDVLGIPLEKDEIISRLNAFGFKVTKETKTFINVLVPSYRNNINMQIDLVEEIGRNIGYENIKSTSLLLQPNYNPDQVLKKQYQISQTLIARGYQELISYGINSLHYAKQFASEKQVVRIDNPLSEEFACLRTSIVSSLLLQIHHCMNNNIHRGQLFEFGKSYVNSDVEKRSLALAVYGQIDPQGFDRSYHFDENDIKGDVVAAISNLFPGQNISFRINRDEVPLFFHPGYTAQILLNNTSIGWLGPLHPTLAQEYSKNIYFAELDFDALIRQEVAFKHPQPSSKFQACTRDISVIISDTVTNNEIMECIKNSSSITLKQCYLIDRYVNSSNSQITNTYRLVFQSREKTFLDKEVNQAIDSIIHRLSEIGANIKESQNDNIN